MKQLLFLILLFPFGLAAQQSDSVNSDKLSKWYRNSYQPSNEKPTIVADQKEQSNTIHPIPHYRKEPGAFLYLPYVVPHYTYNQSQILRNTPYYNYAGYMDPTGASTVGQLLLAGGINYLVDKAGANREKKPKKKN